MKKELLNELKPGDTFKYNHQTYRVIGSVGQLKVNVYNLNSNRSERLPKYTKVTKIS